MIGGYKRLQLIYSYWAAKSAVNAGSARLTKEWCFLQGDRIDKRHLEFLESLSLIEINDFDRWHRLTVNKINKKFKFMSYGVGAKFLAIFLKTYYMMNEEKYAQYKNMIHPPVDSNTIEVLKSELKRKQAFSQGIPKGWVNLNFKEYSKIIGLIKSNFNYLYQIEENWL